MMPTSSPRRIDFHVHTIHNSIKTRPTKPAQAGDGAISLVARIGAELMDQSGIEVALRCTAGRAVRQPRRRWRWRSAQRLFGRAEWAPAAALRRLRGGADVGRRRSDRRDRSLVNGSSIRRRLFASCGGTSAILVDPVLALNERDAVVRASGLHPSSRTLAAWQAS
jgi:hypothetical protein